MNLTQNKWLLPGIVTVVFLTTSGLAMHFKIRADHFEQHYLDTVLEAETLRERLNAPRHPVVEPRPVQVVQATEAMDSESLLERIAELEQAVAERDQLITVSQTSRRFAQPPMEEDASEPRERRDRMEELRENDPERYEELMRRREEMRQRVQDSFARKASHFLYRDLSLMSEAEQEEYQHMLGLLGDTWDLHDRMQEGELSREDRDELRQAYSENIRSLRPMLSAQRDREFYELGLQLGYNDQSAVEFVDYINNMIDITTLNMWSRGGRRGGFGSGGGPGGER